MRKPFPFGLASLFYFVSVIVSLCAKKQMRWITTGWIIALVKNVKGIRYVPEMNLPRNAVGQEYAFGIMPTFNFPIPYAIGLSDPLPASVRFNYLRPKTLSNGTVGNGNTLVAMWISLGNYLIRFDVFTHIVFSGTAPYNGAALAI